MRKIEKEMLQAIKSGINWHSADTRVTKLASGLGVFLHRSHIATWPYGADAAVPNLDTFRQWPTATTCSRLRALGIDASIKNGEPCIDGKAI